MKEFTGLLSNTSHQIFIFHHKLKEMIHTKIIDKMDKYASVKEGNFCSHSQSYEVLRLIQVAFLFMEIQTSF